MALHATLKAAENGAKVVTMSGSGGYEFTADGFSKEVFEDLHDAKTAEKVRLEEFAADRKELQFHDHDAPWPVECDTAMPRAT